MEIYAWIESVFQIAVQYGILAMEALGMAVLLVTAARSAQGWLTGDPHVRLTLAQASPCPWSSSWAARYCGRSSSEIGASWEFLER